MPQFLVSQKRDKADKLFDFQGQILFSPLSFYTKTQFLGLIKNLVLNLYLAGVLFLVRFLIWAVVGCCEDKPKFCVFGLGNLEPLVCGIPGFFFVLAVGCLFSGFSSCLLRIWEFVVAYFSPFENLRISWSWLS